MSDQENNVDVVSILSQSYDSLDDVPESFRSSFKPAPLDPARGDKVHYTFNGTVPAEKIGGLVKSLKAVREERDEVLSKYNSMSGRASKTEVASQDSTPKNDEFLAQLKASYEADILKRNDELQSAKKMIEEMKQREIHTTISSKLRAEAQKSGVSPDLLDDFVKLNVGNFELSENEEVKLKMGYGSLSDWLYTKKEASPAYWGTTSGGGAVGSNGGAGGTVTISMAKTTAAERVEIRRKAEASGKTVKVVD